MLSSFDKIIPLLVLTAFVTIAIFSFTIMTHGQDGSMQNDCPFSMTGVSLCPQSAVAMIFHHISTHNSLFNIPVNFDISKLVVFWLLVAYAMRGVFKIDLALDLPITIAAYSGYFPDTSYKRKIALWLALHENSPTKLSRMPV